MKKLLWTVTAAAVAAGLVTGLPHAWAATGTVETPAILWGTCPAPPAGIAIDPRQTCGTLRVPLDYRRPGGRQISVTVSRIPATDPAQRRGVLLMNPGGPGGQGLTMPSEAQATVSKPVLAGYDLIGFDPRGVSRSTPVTCGLTAAQLTLPLPYPAPDGSIARNVAFARSAAAGCAEKSGDLLPYITTANTARDMDRIRQALGEPRVSYFGVSYGTYLGAVYASLFPQHTDRMVLDSAINPARVWYDELRQQSKGLAIRFPDVARYAADHASEIGFGRTPAAVTRSYLALTKRLDGHPATVPGAPATLDGNMLRFLTRALVGSDSNIPTLAQLWRAAADLSAGHATADQTGLLQQVLALTSPSNGLAPGVPEDNAIAAIYAVVCDDASWPHDVREYAANVAADRAAFPLSAGSAADIMPCAFWSRPIEPAVRVTDHGPRNILILQNKRDPNAPLESGRGMHKALGARSAMVTVDAGGHGVYGTPGPDACATRAADAYLTGGKLPARDVRCPAS
jgi:pimeloyl-ACP methyl ester carboxylesterase